MRYFAALVLVLLPATVCSAKPQPKTSTLTSQDRQHLLSDTFQTYRSISAIPTPVSLDPNLLVSTASGERLPSAGVPPSPMAEPGQRFQADDMLTSPALPSRRLIFVALSRDLCVVAYEHGGFAHEQRVALFRLTDGRAALVWLGDLPGRLSDLADVKKSVQQDGWYEVDRRRL